MGEENVYRAALAGLLHDVGKFKQRSDETLRFRSHQDVGGEVVRELIPEPWRRGLYPVMGHHDEPLVGYETKVVALADRLSAGERADETQEQPKQLLSIFCRLDADEERAPDAMYWPLKPLALQSDVLFPQRELQSEKEVMEAYRELWKAFADEAARLRDAHQTGDELRVYLESLLLLMQRYTWCIPSAYYRALPDVSLYDHSRMTAALAACITGEMDEATLDRLLVALKTRREAEKQDLLQQTPVALLVGGDISGVQDFIYTITSNGATPGLRGRSFYLQLLTEVVARYILRRLALPFTNLIYQGGGAFYLLARVSDREALREIQREISQVLLWQHRGDVYLAIGALPLNAADFYDGHLSASWEKLSAQLRTVKQRRFAELEQDLQLLFVPQGHGGNEEQLCQVCGQEHPHTQLEQGSSEDETGVRKCPPCKSYEDLGDALRQARYLWLLEREAHISAQPMQVTPGSWQEVLEALGYTCGVARDVKEVPIRNGGYRVILALKDDALEGLSPDRWTVVGRRFLVNVTPVLRREDKAWLEAQTAEVRHRLLEDHFRTGAVKPFSFLEAQAKGIKRLGVLRMDLDNGGRLFSDGFSERNARGEIVRRYATLSRIAALSFAISLYFEGWVEVIAEAINAGTRAERGDTVYSIYSGGDDLFFVGAWDQVVELARRIRADLTPFAAYHPGIHVSAGVVLVGGKYPLYQAAEDAGAAEKRAKDYAGKDAITFLGQVVPWSRFGLEEEGRTDTADAMMKNVYAMTRRLERMVKPEREDETAAPQALLRRLIQLQDMYDAEKDRRRRLGQSGSERVYWGPWIWRGYYVLKRMAGKKHAGEPWASIDAIAEALKGEHFKAIEWIGLAARWADLLTR